MTETLPRTSPRPAEMTLDDLVDDLVARVATGRWEALPASARAATRSLTLDALGVAAAAPAAPSMRATMKAQARAAGVVDAAECGIHVPFGAVCAGAAQAASALSVAVHAWDFDDTHDDAVVHSACVALPAALAVAQECGAGGRALLEGVVAGAEVLCRLGLALGDQPGVVRTVGLGSLAAAAAASRVLGLDHGTTACALALALPMALAPGTRQVVVDSAPNKRHQPSYAVHAGVMSAYLAAEGVTGPRGWWSGEHGLARRVRDVGAARRHLTRDGWEIERISLKPIPACRYAHAAVAGVLELSGGVPAPDARVHVQLPEGAAHRMVSRPYRRRGVSIVDAQFSLPWLVAAVLVRGGVGLAEMTGEVLSDGEIERVARDQVTVAQDQDAGDRVMTPVLVHLEDAGAVSTTRVDALPGSPERPLTPDEHGAKLRGCLAVTGRSEAEVGVTLDRLEALTADLPQLDAAALTDRLRALGDGRLGPSNLGGT
ncbi:MAG: MmgE/PrpD family protein [Nocardioidaceae bacterium]